MSTVSSPIPWVKCGCRRAPTKTAYYGAQTQRAAENSPISGVVFPAIFIHGLGLVKYAGAVANEALGLLDNQIASAIGAAREVVPGQHDTEFVVEIFQTGSAASTNMDTNEVIANRALELIGKNRDRKEIHPNDYVNMGNRAGCHPNRYSQSRA